MEKLNKRVKEELVKLGYDLEKDCNHANKASYSTFWILTCSITRKLLKTEFKEDKSYDELREEFIILDKH